MKMHETASKNHRKMFNCKYFKTLKHLPLNINLKLTLESVWNLYKSWNFLKKSSTFVPFALGTVEWMCHETLRVWAPFKKTFKNHGRFSELRINTTSSGLI